MSNIDTLDAACINLISQNEISYAYGLCICVVHLPNGENNLDKSALNRFKIQFLSFTKATITT
jgi:hypothetical protein